MDTSKLKHFAQVARRQLLDQVRARMEQVLRTDSVEIREKQKVVDELQAQINQSSKGAVIDRVAYTWFNRFCALRFMDVNNYTHIGMVSPTPGFTQPEILQEAKQGVFDESLKADRERVQDLLSGNIPSSSPQQEAYRLLLVGACNAYHDMMPFLFEEIEDYTELLMPDDLLSEKSVLQGVRDTLTPEACEDVEVIGWLYQYYISERKDEVFANLKNNKKIQPEDIPAATQLFTPHWIVRYLVENSLGRLWMLNHPESKLVEQMEYYIRPEQEETDFLEIDSPEEIKVCDPACGSGHMLTYAFDLLYTIYEKQGYDPVEIPRMIIENNLYGIEIDERAGDLAAFALMMKAREKDKRFFERDVEPNVCVLENVHFTNEELDRYMDAVGRDLFTQDLRETLTQFEHADNFGSLIQPKAKDVKLIQMRITEQRLFDDLFLHHANQKVLKVLEQTEYLSHGYHVVVANPPYMSSQGMNVDIKEFSQTNYPHSKTDTYSMFIENNLNLVHKNGFVGMITIPNWMFLGSFEEFREKLFAKAIITNFNHNGRGVWGSDFGSCSFVLLKNKNRESVGQYKRLFNKQGEVNSNTKLIEYFFNHDDFPFYHVSVADLAKIPGMPIAYWIPDAVRKAFKNQALSSQFESGGRCKTTNDEKYVRYLWEVATEDIGMNNKWCLLYKGGSFQKYYGNKDYVFKWTQEAKDFYSSVGGLTKEKFWDREGITWTIVTAKKVNSFRIKDKGAQYSSVSPTIFPLENNNDLFHILGFLNSVVGNTIQKALNSTLAMNVGNVLSTPISKEIFSDQLIKNTRKIVEIAKLDWDSNETSFAFKQNSLILNKQENKKISTTYQEMLSYWTSQVQETQRLENENNKLCIDAFSLRGLLDEKPVISDITLNCNVHYRYPDTKGKQYSDVEREAMLRAGTMREFISYAVGCMFGRYSLDNPGIILANQGETVEDYFKQVPNPSFAPDEDKVIPLLDEGWFPDDITERFKDFLKISFGDQHYEENLAFLEEAIGRDIRSYFLKDFYKEHLKMYKKRPIYWLFSSLNGSFNALIYMHRYRPDTISIILNDYLRAFREKLNARKAHLQEIERSTSASSSDKTKALKEIDKMNGILSEIKAYEDEILYPLATQNIEIDLDDGVKVNYKKFGKALKHVSGLS